MLLFVAAFNTRKTGLRLKWWHFVGVVQRSPWNRLFRWKHVVIDSDISQIQQLFQTRPQSQHWKTELRRLLARIIIIILGILTMFYYFLYYNSYCYLICLFFSLSSSIVILRKSSRVDDLVCVLIAFGVFVSVSVTSWTRSWKQRNTSNSAASQNDLLKISLLLSRSGWGWNW